MSWFMVDIKFEDQSSKLDNWFVLLHREVWCEGVITGVM